jgi:hypothetical protein
LAHTYVFGRHVREPTVRNGMGSVYVGLARLAIRRPWLIPAMLATAWAVRANRWYQQLPFLPLPSKAYIRWRMETAYGRGVTVVPSGDLERYVRWGSDMRKHVKGSKKW